MKNNLSISKLSLGYIYTVELR